MTTLIEGRMYGDAGKGKLRKQSKHQLMEELGAGIYQKLQKLVGCSEDDKVVVISP